MMSFLSPLASQRNVNEELEYFKNIVRCYDWKGNVCKIFSFICLSAILHVAE